MSAAHNHAKTRKASRHINHLLAIFLHFPQTGL
jgi:hypothetical protein